MTDNTITPEEKVKFKDQDMWSKIAVWWMVTFGDWPVYRVTYSDLTVTRVLCYGEAKSMVSVWKGRLWTDWDYAMKLYKMSA